MVMIMLAFLGSILGFLYHNLNPAKVFMGDSGSMFLGFILAAMTSLSTFYTNKASTIFPIIMPMIILAVPIFEMIIVIAIRIRNKKPVYSGDKNHISHRLTALGMTQRDAVGFIYLLTFCTGLGGLLLWDVTTFGGIIILLQVLIFFCLIIMLENIKTNKTNSQ